MFAQYECLLYCRLCQKVVMVMCIHVSLGCLEDGTALGDVVLPPWAKGDPQEFIRIHREVSDP